MSLGHLTSISVAAKLSLLCIESDCNGLSVLG